MPNMIPKDNKMPDISNITTALGCYLASSMAGGFQANGYDKTKKTIITRFVTLVDKAKYEYLMAREAVDDEIKEGKMSYEEIMARGEGQYMHITTITNHLENCIITLGILFKLLEKLDNTAHVKFKSKNITDIRNSVVHIEDRIISGVNGGIILSINEEGTTISLLKHKLSVADLAQVIKDLNAYIRNLL